MASTRQARRITVLKNNGHEFQADSGRGCFESPGSAIPLGLTSTPLPLHVGFKPESNNSWAVGWS